MGEVRRGGGGGERRWGEWRSVKGSEERWAK